MEWVNKIIQGEENEKKELLKKLPKTLKDNQSFSPLGVNLDWNHGWNCAIAEVRRILVLPDVYKL